MHVRRSVLRNPCSHPHYRTSSPLSLPSCVLAWNATAQEGCHCRSCSRLPQDPSRRCRRRVTSSNMFISIPISLSALGNATCTMGVLELRRWAVSATPPTRPWGRPCLAVTLQGGHWLPVPVFYPIRTMRGLRHKVSRAPSTLSACSRRLCVPRGLGCKFPSPAHTRL